MAKRLKADEGHEARVIRTQPPPATKKRPLQDGAQYLLFAAPQAPVALSLREVTAQQYRAQSKAASYARERLEEDACEAECWLICMAFQQPEAALRLAQLHAGGLLNLSDFRDGIHGACFKAIIEMVEERRIVKSSFVMRRIENGGVYFFDKGDLFDNMATRPLPHGCSVDDFARVMREARRNE